MNPTTAELDTAATPAATAATTDISTAAATPATAAQATADENRWLLPVYAHTPVEPVRGDGALLWTRDGRELIDFYGGHAVALLGYRHPRLLSALAAQAESLFFQSNSVPLAVRARAAARLVAFAPPLLETASPAKIAAAAHKNTPSPSCRPLR